jgi:hypothetical protein
MEDPIVNQGDNDPSSPVITADMETSAQERAAAIAETQVLPNLPPTAARRTGGGTRGNTIADEAILAGDVQIFDEAGQEVQRLFTDFLSG